MSCTLKALGLIPLHFLIFLYGSVAITAPEVGLEAQEFGLIPDLKQLLTTKARQDPISKPPQILAHQF